ncbi:MAG: type II toxin-antitoxin system death-on-curing family toxin [Planctomycetaceae bacterium]|nr:type II toxin-antitoxin system death-on-curing family toxin [Planctomycetaceae bacterium]
MIEPTFLTLREVLAIHQRMIDEFGGMPGVGDQGLLESALATPQTTFGGRFLHPTVAAMAAAYLFHLCSNHPFMDGNKRTALAAAEVFIKRNRCRLNATNDELERLTLSVADSSMTKESVTAFFSDRVEAEQGAA